MKKTLSIILSTVLLFCAAFSVVPTTVSATEPGYGQNMLTNSNFETGPFNTPFSSPGYNSSFNTYNNWFRVTAGDAVINNQIIADPANSANHIAKVMQTVLQGAAVKSGTDYQLNFKIRSEAAFNISLSFLSHDDYTTANNGLAYTKLSDIGFLAGTKGLANGKTTEMVSTADYSLASGVLTLPVAASSEWTVYSFRFTVGSYNAALQPILQLKAENYNSSDAKSFYLDDVTLCKTLQINNLITDSGFENYAANTVLGSPSTPSPLWKTNSEASTWYQAKVISTGAYSGNNCLSLFARHNTAYRSVSGLTANTDYVFSFYYYLPVQTAADSVKFTFSAVAPSTATIDSSGATISPNLVMASNVANGDGVWKKQVVTFNSGSNTSVNIYFRFNSEAGTGAASTLLVDDIMMYPLTDVSPTFDGNAGSVTCDYGLATGDSINYKAVAFADNSFGGWYSHGIKSEYKANLKVSQYNACDYSMTFVDNSLTQDAGFENYASGTNMKLQTDITQWYSATNNGATWPTVTVDNTMAHSGKSSLSIFCMSNAAYRKVDGLSKNTLYSLSFYYYLPLYTASNTAALSYVSVVPGTTSAVTYNGNETGDSIRHIRYTGTNYQGTGTWKKINIIFDSSNNSSVYVAFGYTAGQSSGVKMNIDEFTLSPYHGDAFILNNDFEQGNTKLWSATAASTSFTAFKNVSAPAELGTYCAKMTTTADFEPVFSPTIQFEGGSTYDVSMWLKFDSAYPTTMELPNGQPSDTFADFGLMNDKLVESGANAYIQKDTATIGYKRFDADNNLIASSSNISSEGSRCAVSPTSINNAALGQWNRFVFTITAPSYSTASFAIRLNCKGTAYVDGFTITKTESSASAQIAHAITKVGSAIRLTGSQGIRYKNRIDRNALAADYSGYRIVEYGAVAIKSAYLGGSDLVLNGTYNYNGSIKSAATGVSYRESDTDTIDRRYSETKNTIDFSVVLINISSSNYSENYTVRPYVIIQNASGTRATVYCDTQNDSIMRVAQVAYNAKTPDQNFTESDQARSYLFNQILVRANLVELSVNNGGSPLTTNFKGLSSTVYHCYTFMKDSKTDSLHNDPNGRNYTEAMATIEMNRLKDSGISTVRSIFKSEFAWDTTTSRWNWNSTNMQKVYQWAKMLQDRGIDIAFNAGWHLNFFTDGDSSIPEVNYLLGNGIDYYSESAGVDFSGMTPEQIRMKKASLRYGEWIKQAMQAMKANGVNNVKYLLLFTEPSYKTETQLEGASADAWILMATGLNQKLKDAGIRSQYKLVGPNQGSTPTGEGLLKYVLEHMADPSIIDIYTTHFYPNSDSIYKDNYGAICDNTFSSYMGVMQSHNSTKDFWCDEFYACSTANSKMGQDNAWAGTQTAVGLASAMSFGMEGMISWQFTDQLWPNSTYTGGEFKEGFHAVGMAPSLLNSYIPKAQYYATGITSRYFGGGGGSVYSCNTVAGSGLYISCAKLADGNWTIMVVNAGTGPASFRTTLSSAINKTMNRHLFDPASVNPTAEAKLAGIDTTFNVTNTLSDTIPSGGVAIYTTRAD